MNSLTRFPYGILRKHKKEVTMPDTSETIEKVVIGVESNEELNTLGDMNVGAKVESRITAGGALGTVSEEMIPDKGEPTRWYLRILGEMTGYETGRSQFGPFVKLKGEFTVTDLRDGTVKGAKTAILPGLGENVIKRQADHVGFGTESGPRSIVFGMEIGLDWNKPDIKSVNGKEIVFKKYMWAIRPLGSTVETPLMRLTRELNARAAQATLAGAGDAPVSLIEASASVTGSDLPDEPETLAAPVPSKKGARA
jgi:hypothetical protein